MKKAFGIFVLLCICINTFAQYRLSGTVRNEDEQLVTGAVLQLYQDTTLIAVAMTNHKGEYALTDLKAGAYDLEVACYGYATLLECIDVSRNQRLDFLLEYEHQAQIDEVVVVADKSLLTTATAKGTMFYLSERAKALQDPYEALTEIPALTVMPSERSIKLTDGRNLLVMVNGNRYNGGIESLNPSDIEDVEIIENPSARYLREGVQAILNVNVKHKEVVYQVLRANTQHMVPILFGGSSAFYEVGNEKVSVSFQGTQWYYHHEDIDIKHEESNINYQKQYQGERVFQTNFLKGNLNADWRINAKNYLVLNATSQYEPNKTETSASGTYQEAGGEKQDLAFDNTDEVKANITSFNLFYRHTHSKGNYLEMTGRLNLNGNTTRGIRQENYPTWSYQNQYDFDNYRYSGGLEMFYTRPIGKQTLEAGNTLSFTKDRLRQTLAGLPTFHSRNVNEYVYGELSGFLTKKMSYDVSLGMDIISRKSADITYNYVRPVENLALNYRFNTFHVLNVSYQLTNFSPSIGELNPYNTSTDSMHVKVGNPYLKPSRQYQWRIAYTYNKNGIYIVPSVRYNRQTQVVEQVGYTDAETGVFTQTYGNVSHFSLLNEGLSLNYRNSKWGNVGIRVNNYTLYYQGQSAKDYVSYYFSYNVRYRKWVFNGYLDYTPKSYGQYTKTKRYGVNGSNFNVRYTINSHLRLDGTLRYWLGPVRTKSWYQSGTYYNFNDIKNRERSFCFLLGFTYTFQKHETPKYNRKSLDNTESGISL